MSSLNDSGAIFSYHRDMIAHYGKRHSKALGWMGNNCQLSRFNALSCIADMSNHSVLDAGCGYGDLSAHLHSLYSNNLTYYGVEQIPELLEEAERRYGKHRGTHFLPKNFMVGELPVCDYVLACGSLNYRSSDPDFIYKAIAKLFASSRRGMGFNLLSSIPENGLIVAYDAHLIYNYCQTLGAGVSLIDNYAENDFTIFIYH